MASGWAPAGHSETPAEGETFVAGKDKPTAQALLAACEAVGLPRWMVRTSARGFIVPDAVYDRYAGATAESHGI